MRRGLAGEIVSNVSALAGAESITILLACLTAFYALFLLLVYRLFSRLGESPIWLALLISPGFVLGYALEGNRKEIVLFFVLTLFLLLVRGKKSSQVLGIIVLTLGGPITVLVHEGLFFGIPFLLIALMLSVRENLIPPMWAWVSAGVSMVLSGTAFVFSARFRGDLELAERICQKQNTEGPAEDICSEIYPLADSTDFAVASVISMIQYHGFLLVYPLAFPPRGNPVTGFISEEAITEFGVVLMASWKATSLSDSSSAGPTGCLTPPR